MKVVFVSNYYNHHQSAISEEFFKQTDGNYFFIQTQPMDEERQNLGWKQKSLPDFVVESYNGVDTYNRCLRIINEADVVIVGSAPEKMIRKRIRDGKLVFRYSERIYKNWKKHLQLPLRFVKYHYDNFPEKNVYMLCASAYAARDYAKTGNFVGKTFKWGYFPRVINYRDLNEVVENKSKNTLSWVARFLDWKHPEVPIRIAKRLFDDGYDYSLSMIGVGEQEDNIRRLIKEYGLENNVKLLGAMSPDDVRSVMLGSEIFLFTSDFNEGWGAVLNEAMNSACAVVASHAVGSAPFLINNGENGYIYRNGDEEDLYSKVKELLDKPNERKRLSFNAYKTMSEYWNAEFAVNAFLNLCQSIKQGETISNTDNIPCAIAL